MAGLYSEGEVAWLMSISRRDAIGFDAYPRSQVARFSPGGHAHTAVDPTISPVPTIARWHDVRAARERVVTDHRDRILIFLRTLEFTEREVAEFFELSKSAIHQRFRARFDDILAVLGGAATPPERTSQVSACMRCGERPRVRVAARRRRVRGGWFTIAPERLGSLCWECWPPDNRDVLIAPREWADADG
jgi:hypothetical protein